MSKYSKLLENLNENLNLFIQEVDRQKLVNMATEEWTVKDVLCHIVFWHQYYAQQYSALAEGKKAVVFTSKGGSTRNKEGVNKLKHKTKKELVSMLQSAQKKLAKCIINHDVSEMNYTDKRKYTTDEFLDIVARHIVRHADQVRKARRLSNK